MVSKVVSTDAIHIWASMGSSKEPANDQGSYLLKSFIQFEHLIGCGRFTGVLA